MTAENRILQVVKHAPSIRKEVIAHLLTSFESWQESLESCPNAAPYYSALEWFAIQEIESEWKGVSI